MASEIKRFRCSVTDGGGTENDAGLWYLTVTNKRMIFQWIDDDTVRVPDFTDIRISRDNKELRDGELRYWGYGHVLIDHEDGAFTAYPNQCGTPYYFEPIVPVIAAKEIYQPSLLG